MWVFSLPPFSLSAFVKTMAKGTPFSPSHSVNSRSMAWGASRPVSYTHLDVYKRQAQHSIVLQLAKNHQHVCVVGDDAQSIYSFRGADIDNILYFTKVYPLSLIHI